MKPSYLIAFILIASFQFISASSYGNNAIITGSLNVGNTATLSGDVNIGTATTTTVVAGTFVMTGATTLPNEITIGTYAYDFPTSSPSSTSQVLGVTTTTQPLKLGWVDFPAQPTLSTSSTSTGSSIVITGTGLSLTVAGIKGGSGISVSGPINGDVYINSTVSITKTTGSTGVSLVAGSSPNFQINAIKGSSSISVTGPTSGDVTITSLVTVATATGSVGTALVTGVAPNYQINGLKQGNGILITSPTAGDVTISSSILQTAITYPIVFHPTGARPNPASFTWPGWTNLVPTLSTSTAPTSCSIYGSGANGVTCDLTNNSGSGTPQCVTGNNNDLSFTTANPTAKNTCSSAFTATLAGNTLQTLSISCSGNILSVLLICTI